MKFARPPIHANVYGPAGTGKSFLLRTFTPDLTGGPALVECFDPRGKDSTYFEDADSIESGEHNLGTNAQGQRLVVPYTDILDSKGNLLRRVEYLHEDQLEFGDENQDKQDFLAVSGWNVVTKLRRRFNQVFREEKGFWATLGWDSTTSSELMIRSFQKYVQNPGARGEARKQWWGAGTDEHEMFLAIRLGGFPGNVVVISHTDKDRSADESGGVLRYTPRLPGRLAGDLSTYYPEVYHAYTRTRDDGETEYLLQTRPSELYTAFSQTCGAPNPCPNNYEALWANFESKRKALTK